MNNGSRRDNGTDACTQPRDADAAVREFLAEGYSISAVAELPTRSGHFQVRVVQDREGRDHVLVYKGELKGRADVPVRIHSECLTSEVFHSMRCDCEQQLAAALAFFESQGSGLLIYLRQEGRGIGLLNKINAYALQDSGLDTVEANVELGFPNDSRTYDMAVDCLRMLEIKSICLMTNNPKKLDALRHHNFEVTRRIPLHIEPDTFNGQYLRTKRAKMDHLP